MSRCKVRCGSWNSGAITPSGSSSENQKRSPSKKVVLNLSQVPYMDSSAVAVLVELLRKLNGGKIFLTDLQKRVQGLLEVAKLSTIFKIVPTEKEALA